MICDAHIHVGQLSRANVPHYYSPIDIAETLKENGVSEFIFSSMSVLMAEDNATYQQVRSEAEETVHAFGHGAHPFLWITGRFYDADNNLSMLDDELWQGVKIHELDTPWVKERPKDLERILAIVEERGLPVQFHTGEDKGCYPHELLPFVKKHPNLRVDFAHCRPWKETIDCLRECGNLFTDTAFMLAEHYGDLVDADVEDRVMFGTDLPLQCALIDSIPEDIRAELDMIYAAELSAARGAGYSERVMSENFHRYLWG